MPINQKSQLSQSIRQNQELFRIREEYRNGDRYSLDGASLALALGPDSDLSNIVVEYLDPQKGQVPQKLNIAAGAAFMGRLDARLDESFKTGPNDIGRIMVYSNDVVFDAAAFSGIGDIETLDVIKPIFDIVAYTKEVNQVPIKRAPKRYSRNIVLGPGSVTYRLYVPTFGRKRVTVTTSLDVGAGLTPEISIGGLNSKFPVNSSNSTTSTTLLALETVPNGIKQHVFDSATVGEFSYYTIIFNDFDLVGFSSADLVCLVEVED